jgi:hypothetical protein
MFLYGAALQAVPIYFHSVYTLRVQFVTTVMGLFTSHHIRSRHITPTLILIRVVSVIPLTLIFSFLHFLTSKQVLHFEE